MGNGWEKGFGSVQGKVFRLMEFGSGSIQVEGLQYVVCLMVRGRFLKWNCFFID